MRGRASLAKSAPFDGNGKRPRITVAQLKAAEALTLQAPSHRGRRFTGKNKLGPGEGRGTAQ